MEVVLVNDEFSGGMVIFGFDEYQTLILNSIQQPIKQFEYDVTRVKLGEFRTKWSDFDFSIGCIQNDAGEYEYSYNGDHVTKEEFIELFNKFDDLDES